LVLWVVNNKIKKNRKKYLLTMKNKDTYNTPV